MVVMENLDLLTNLGKIAGIAGISLGVVFLLFRGIIQKNIFPNLTKEHAFRVIRMIVYACTVIAIFGIAAWVYGGNSQKNADLLTVRATGYVVDQQGNGLGNVVITAREIEGPRDITDSDGKYVISFNGTGSADYTLIYKRSGFKTKAKKIPLDFSRENENIEQVTLLAVEDVEISDDAGTKTATPKNDSPVAKTDITLIYAGDDYGCSLNLVVTVDGKTIKPTSNSATIKDVELGETEYKITGNIVCAQLGSCVARGTGYLSITKGGVYYLLWNSDGYNSCSISLITQDEFNSIYGL